MAIKYVSTTGINTPFGGGISNPWGTIAYAVAQLVAGDTLFMRGGTYTGSSNVIDSSLNTVPSGTSGARITISGYVGETVILEPPSGVHPLKLTTGAPSYLTFQDFEIDGTNMSGAFSPELIYLSDGAHHNRFQRLLIHDGKFFGVVFSNNGGDSHSNELLDCEIHSIGVPGSSDPLNGHAVYVLTSNNLVRGNYIHDNGGAGLDFFNNAGAYDVHDNILDRNRICRNGIGPKPTQHAIVIAWGADNIVRNNLVYDNKDGILVYTDADNAQILNNTIFGNVQAGIEMQFYASAPVIKNNIVFGNGSDITDNGGTGSPDYGGAFPGSNLLTDPDFTDSASGDFTLQAGSPASPAIDAGLTLAAVTDDFLGNARPAGAGYDIGAYESGASGAGGSGGSGAGGSGGESGGSPTSPPSGPGGGGGAGSGAGAAVGIVTDTYSDIDMQCPSRWENGFKEGLVDEWGDVERASSHLFTGEWQGSTFNFQIADKENRFRKQAASFTERYWNDALTVRMTTIANRAVEGLTYTVFCGPIIEAQFSQRGLLDITLGDAVSQGALSDQGQIPWRVVRDGFLSQLDAISGSLDLDTPEPILYGRHTRAAADLTSPSSDEAIRVVPIYLGIENIGGLDRHVWLVCGHATAALDIYIDGQLSGENFGSFVDSSWWIPHQPDWQAQFGAPYVDRTSDTYGNLRRYTLIYGRVGREAPDDCALGDRTMTADVWGVEDVGDGTGALITDRFQQYKHFLVNFVANVGAQSYQSGAWLANPTWDIFDGPVEKVEEASFDAGTAIGDSRLIGGYVGAAAIGVQSGDRASAKKWIADWNRSCACRFGITHLGQMRIFLLHPTDAEKAAAILYTDAYEILEDSFRSELAWDQHANSIPFKADFNNETGEWITNGVETDATTVTNYGRTISSEVREYPFAPGMFQAQHLAILELRIRKHKPAYIRLSGTIGPDPVTDESLGYRDIGEYIRYEHFDAIAETREQRLAQIITPGIRVGPRIVTQVAMDCDDLIDYDVNSSP